MTREKRQTRRILIAEDNAINLEIAVRVLASSGYKSDAVKTGLEVLSALEKAHYDAILMDCQMPEMDGYDATIRIRAMGRTIPVIALTASAFNEDREVCFKAGMSDFLAKPIQPALLIHTLDSWVIPQNTSSNMSLPTKVESMIQKPIGQGVMQSRLDTLALLDKSSDGNLIPRLIDMYESTMPASLLNLRNLAQTKDRNLSRSAHAMKSSSSNLGAEKVSHLLQQIEDSQLSETELPQALDTLEKEIADSITEMKAYMADKANR